MSDNNFTVVIVGAVAYWVRGHWAMFSLRFFFTHCAIHRLVRDGNIHAMTIGSRDGLASMGWGTLSIVWDHGGWC